MNILPIQSNQINFEAIKRYLDKKSINTAQEVLKKMNSETIFEQSGYSFVSKGLNALKIDKEIYLHDKRALVAPCNSLKGRALLTIGNSEIEFDIETGEVINCKKSIFKSKNRILKKAANILNFMGNNYNNSDYVTKIYTIISGFTEEGFRKLWDSINKKSKKGKSSVPGVNK